MKPTDLICALRGQLNRLAAQGHSAVDIAALEAYLTSVEPAARQGGDEEAREALAAADLRFEEWKVKAPLEHAGRMEMFRSVMEAGRTTLNSLIIMNGGAAIALLAFLGNVLAKDPPVAALAALVPGIRAAMLDFVVGVGLAGASSALRYLTQLLSAGRPQLGGALTIMAIVVGLGSLALFFVGGLTAFRAFG